jgi:phosphoribosylglycinamide formyltransferase 1
MKRIAIFASGSGTNAQRIIEHFAGNDAVSVSLVLTNKPDAFVLERARKFNVPTHVFDRKRFYETREVLTLLQSENIDLIVLAGFLWLIPQYLIKAFPGRIINIHPALLPDYGGKGMYGEKVHRAVIESGDKKSGITIHFVDELYDHGSIIFQATCDIDRDETPGSLAEKVHKLEHQYYPLIIEQILCS